MHTVSRDHNRRPGFGHRLPADAKLDEFPQPNPYFPPPPRPSDGWTWKGAMGFAFMFASSMCVIVLMVLDVFTTPYGLGPLLALVAVLGVVIGSIGSSLATYNVWRRRLWRRGVIFPARIIRAPRQIPWYLGLIMLVVPVGGLDLLTGFFFGSFTARVEYMAGGVTRNRSIWWTRETPPVVGTSCWIVRSPWIGQTCFLYQSWAPAKWLLDAPSDDVVRWLEEALSKADRQYSYRGGTYDKRA